jgi:hypothetical protein
LFFFAAFLLMAACMVAPRLGIQLPPLALQLWPWRAAFVGGLSLLALVFLVLQLSVGFGLEQDSEGTAVYYTLRRTLWLWLAVFFQLLAVVGSTLNVWLVARKSRPLPRIDVSW